MSKAFLKEEHSDAPEVVPARAPLPAGTTNYVTPAGLAELQAELAALGGERARLELDGSEAAPVALQQLAARRSALEERLSSAVVITARAEGNDVVRFGAEVSVRGEDGRERRYRIVGVDEADAARGKLAFTAPLSRALLGRRAGESLTVRTPRGEEELEVVALSYPEP